MVIPNFDRLMRLDEVLARTALSRSTVYRLMWVDESFPKPLKVGPRAVRWRESEIEAWITDCPRATGDTPVAKGPP